MQLFIFVVLVAAFAVISLILCGAYAYWKISRDHKADGAAVITRRLRIFNTRLALALACLLAVMLVLEFFSPEFHDHMLNIQYRIGDIFQGQSPAGLNLPVSIIFWLALYLGVLLGGVPGQFLACRWIGRRWMKATRKVKLGDLFGSPWI